MATTRTQGQSFARTAGEAGAAPAIDKRTSNVLTPGEPSVRKGQ